MISPIYKFFTFLLLLSIVLFSVSCKDDKAEDLPTVADRTVLIYMAADNNLSGESYDNISAIKEGALNNLNNGKLLVYQDALDRNPRLIEIFQEGNTIREKVIKTYPEHNSASGDVLSMVVSDAFGLYQSKSKGLMLWSHGTSWLPADKHLWTRSFGVDGKDEMEISEIKKALPDAGFDFIIFDACLMSSIEVVYELKNKANYIVASPNEIFALGFPYKLIVADLFSNKSTEAYLTSICNTFYSFYGEDDIYKSASISLIKTQGLNELASLCRELITSTNAQIDRKSLQAMYHHKISGTPLLFDFYDFYKRLGTESQKDKLANSLSNVVVLKKSTPEIYSSNLLTYFKVDQYSGLSTYIPQESTPLLNAWYYNLDWGKAVFEK